MVFAVIATLGCLAALTTAIVAYLAEPSAQPIAGRPSSPQLYTDREIRQHAHTLVAQIERYLGR